MKTAGAVMVLVVFSEINCRETKSVAQHFISSAASTCWNCMQCRARCTFRQSIRKVALSWTASAGLLSVVRHRLQNSRKLAITRSVSSKMAQQGFYCCAKIQTQTKAWVCISQKRHSLRLSLHGVMRLTNRSCCLVPPH